MKLSDLEWKPPTVGFNWYSAGVSRPGARFAIFRAASTHPQYPEGTFRVALWGNPHKENYPDNLEPLDVQCLLNVFLQGGTP